MSIDLINELNSISSDVDVDVIVKNLSLFDSLDDRSRQQLLSTVEHKAFPEQSLIIREGDFGTEMYVILDGKVEVFATSDDGYETILSELKQGDYFGEQALLPNNNGYRTASIRARTETTTLIINKQSFCKLLEQDRSLQQSLEVIGEKNLNQKLLQESALFRAIQIDSDIKDYVQKKTFSPGDDVIREGDTADDMYVILEGQAEVYQKVANQQVKRNSLGPGRYFGELAFINNEPRNATVTAKTPLCVLALNGKRFGQIFRQTPELNARFSDLNGFYKLPGEGFITLHSSKLLEMDALTTVYHINLSAYMSITRVIGSSAELPICSVNLANNAGIIKNKKIIKYQQQGGIYRELVFADGYVRSGVFYGAWDDLPFLLEALLKGKKLNPWQRYLFEKEGQINLKKERLQLDENAIICQCTGVTLGALKQAMQEGCTTAEQLADATGASRVCGGCAPLLKEVVGLSHMDIIGDIQIIPQTKAVKSIRLTPKLVDILPYQVGQHIRVEGLINGQWVQRPYTLTSSPTNSQYYEITVKKIHDGVFSSWLHNEFNEKSIVRVSEPEGGFDLAIDQNNAPYVCLVAGIGITPVLSLIRNNAALEKHRIHVDISARNREDIPCLEELLQKARDHDQLTINIRLSSECPRIGKSDISQLAITFPNAVFIVCGPSNYQNSVSSHLESADVDADHTRIESFTSTIEKSLSDASIKVDRLSFWVSVLILMLIIGFFITPELSHVRSVKEFPIKGWLFDDTHRQISGYLGISLIAIGLITSARKRLKSFMWGNYANWRLFHILVGSIALVAIATHTAVSMGNNLSFSILILFMAVLITGAFTMLVKVFIKAHPNIELVGIEKRVNQVHIWMSLAMPAVLMSHILASYYY